MRFPHVVGFLATLIAITSAALSVNAKALVFREHTVVSANEKPIKIAIWAPDAADASAATHPLIVISHGNGGSPAAHTDTAEALAEAGYVVVAIAHPGDTKGDDGDTARDWLVERVRHVSRVLDYMTSEWEGRAVIDRSRIGAFGFSAGGLTVLIATGASPSAVLAQEHCRSAASEFACRLKLDAELGRLMGSNAAAYSWPHDDRIKAVVVAAPGLGFSLDRQGLSQIRVPVQLWAAEKDDRAPVATNIMPLLEGIPRRPEYHLIRGADHFAFSRPCKPTEANRHSCERSSDFDRTIFHEQFNAEVVAFFDRVLKQAPNQ